MAFEEIKIEQKTNPIFKFEKVGDKIEGVLTDKKSLTTSVGDSKLYTIKTSDGVEHSVWGKPMINDRMDNVNIGDSVIIEYAEDKKIAGRPLPMKVYKVLVSRNEKKEVALDDIDFDK